MCIEPTAGSMTARPTQYTFFSFPCFLPLVLFYDNHNGL
jgi:hypothetical protein